MIAPVYAELQVTSNFSFLRGASHPEELVETAAALGHAAVAITDRNSLAGVVRAHVAAKLAACACWSAPASIRRTVPGFYVFPATAPPMDALRGC